MTSLAIKKQFVACSRDMDINRMLWRQSCDIFRWNLTLRKVNGNSKNVEEVLMRTGIQTAIGKTKKFIVQEMLGNQL